MNNNELALLALLSDELTNTVIRQNDINYEEIQRLAVRHAVLPLIFYPIKGEEFHAVGYEVFLNKLRSAVIQSVINGEKLMNIQSEVVNLLNSQHIPCAVLKGCSVAALYPHPELRQLGDIDILIPESRLGDVRILLSDNGYTYSSEHEFHVSYVYRGIHIEIHFQITDFPNNDAGEYAHELFSHALTAVDSNCYNRFTFPVLQPLYQLLSLLFHMARHMKSSGIGLRQLCDWHVTIDSCRNEINESILTTLKRCGLFNFAVLLTQCCVNYMNMKPIKCFETSNLELCELMMEEIIESGNMNMINDERKISTAFIEEIGTVKPKSYVGTFISSINGKARTRYPITKRLPVLLPLFWIVIPLVYLFRMHSGKRSRVNITDTLNISKKRLTLYNRIGLFKQE